MTQSYCAVWIPFINISFVSWITFQGPTIGSRLSLENVDRGMAGEFMCLAKNGVEEKDEEIYAEIKLQVQCEFVLLFLTWNPYFPFWFVEEIWKIILDMIKTWMIFHKTFYFLFCISTWYSNLFATSSYKTKPTFLVSIAKCQHVLPDNI